MDLRIRIRHILNRNAEELEAQILICDRHGFVNSLIPCIHSLTFEDGLNMGSIFRVYRIFHFKNDRSDPASAFARSDLPGLVQNLRKNKYFVLCQSGIQDAINVVHTPVLKALLLINLILGHHADVIDHTCNSRVNLRCSWKHCLSFLHYPSLRS